MSIKDIFKNSFLDGFSNGIELKTILLGLAITAVLAIYIFLFYRFVTKSTFYSKSFNVSLIAMAIITAAIILTIQSNIVLSTRDGRRIIYRQIQNGHKEPPGFGVSVLVDQYRYHLRRRVSCDSGGVNDHYFSSDPCDAKISVKKIINGVSCK